MNLVHFSSFGKVYPEKSGNPALNLKIVVRYIQRHKKAMVPANWTIKEDERLVALVRKCRISNYIPWAKVSRALGAVFKLIFEPTGKIH
jgi:hypothetical protein